MGFEIEDFYQDVRDAAEEAINAMKAIEVAEIAEADEKGDGNSQEIENLRVAAESKKINAKMCISKR